MKENTSLITAFSIAGFVIGVLSLVFSFIPCIGMYSAIPGFIGLVLSVIAFVKAKQGNSPKGLAIAAVVICLFAVIIAGWQYTVWQKATEKIDDFTNTMKNLSDSITKNNYQVNSDDFLDEAIDMALDSFDNNSDEIRNALDSMKNNGN